MVLFPHGMHWGVPDGTIKSGSFPALWPYLLDRTLPLAIACCEFTALIAPRLPPVARAVGDRRQWREEYGAVVTQVDDALGTGDRVRYVWYPGDHHFPPNAQMPAVDWFKGWLNPPSHRCPATAQIARRCPLIGHPATPSVSEARPDIGRRRESWHVADLALVLP
jgi:hypothetical protein